MNKRLTLAIILTVVTLLTLAACKPVEPQSILLKSEPADTLYFVGDNQIKLNGGLIEVFYSDKTKKEVPLTDDEITISGFDTRTAGDVKVTVKYQSLTTFFYIKVDAVVAQSCTLEKTPQKTEYYSLDQPDVSDGIFKVEYNNGSSENVAMDRKDVNVTYDFSLIGSTEITVSLFGFSYVFPVTVLKGPDWQLIEEMTDKAVDHIYKLEEPQFLYCYFKLMDEVDKVYATGSLKVIVYYRDNYFDGVEEVKKLCDENTYAYAREFFDDEELNSFIRLFTDLVYKWKYTDGYNVTSEEFCSQTEKLIADYRALSNFKRWSFIFNMYNAYDYYMEVTAEYYSQYLTSQELDVYKLLVQTEYYYNGSKAADYSYHIDLFVRKTRNMQKIYDALENSNAFDELFLEEYEIYCDYLIELNPVAEEIYEINDFSLQITVGLIIKLFYGDYSHLIVSYEILFDMVEAIYDSGDQDLINDFETVGVGNTTLFDKYNKYLEEYEKLMQEISAKGNEFNAIYRKYLDIYRKWIESGAGISEKDNSVNRDLYSDFDHDMKDFIEELEQQPQDIQDMFMSMASVSYAKMLEDYTDNL